MSGPGAGRGSIGELDFGMGRALVPLSPFPRAAFLPVSPRARFCPRGRGGSARRPGPRRFRVRRSCRLCGFEAVDFFDCFVTSLTP